MTPPPIIQSCSNPLYLHNEHGTHDVPTRAAQPPLLLPPTTEALSDIHMVIRTVGQHAYLHTTSMRGGGDAVIAQFGSKWLDWARATSTVAVDRPMRPPRPYGYGGGRSYSLNGTAYQRISVPYEPPSPSQGVRLYNGDRIVLLQPNGDVAMTYHVGEKSASGRTCESEPQSCDRVRRSGMETCDRFATIGHARGADDDDGTTWSLLTPPHCDVDGTSYARFPHHDSVPRDSVPRDSVPYDERLNNARVDPPNDYSTPSWFVRQNRASVHPSSSKAAFEKCITPCEKRCMTFDRKMEVADIRVLEDESACQTRCLKRCSET